MRTLSVFEMVSNITSVENAILDCDGSCRDFNMATTDREAVIELIDWFLSKYQSVSACGTGISEVGLGDLPQYIRTLSTSDTLLIYAGDSTKFLINDIQLFFCLEGNSDIFVEISFFPEDIDMFQFDVSEFLQMLEMWRKMINSPESFLRYENASWKYGDANDFGIIYVSKDS